MEHIITQRIITIKDLPILQKELANLESTIRPVAEKLLEAVNHCHPHLQQSFTNCLRMALAMSSSIAEEEAKIIEVYTAIAECFPEEGKT